MKRWLVIVIVVLVAVAVGAAGVFGGRASAATPSPQEAAKVLSNLTAQQRQQLAQSGALSGAFGNRGTGGANGTGGFTSGSIVGSDSNSITIKLSDGSTKIILYSPSTTISVSATGSASDLTNGQNVTVSGTANSDGSITAARIQVGFGPRGAGGATGGSGMTGPNPGTGGSGSSSNTTSSAASTQ